MSGYDSSDTIVAPATAPGRSAIAMLRLSGPGAWDIARRLCPALPSQIEPRRAYVADVELHLNGGEITDRAVATFWQAPDSYTGEDLVELSLHGNPLMMREATAACVGARARRAEAGEFTYRAYLNGKLDLSQAEAVQELISAGSIKALRLAGASLAGMASRRAKDWVEQLTTLLANIEVIHDYAADDLDASIDPETLLTPEKLGAELEQLAGEFAKALEDSRRTAPLREGVTVALCGPPNVGKSTLFNALIGHERALTHEAPGTTRDYVSETLTSGGFNLTLIDTAGWREASDAVEAAGIAKAGDWARAADVVVWVVAPDRGEQEVPEELAGVKPLAVMTRCDLLEKWPENSAMHCVSGKTGRGVPELWQLLRDRAELTGEDVLDSFSQRQAGRIEAALAALDTALTALNGGMPLDAVAQDMYAARHELHGIYEQEDRFEVINEIFSGFCVGK